MDLKEKEWNVITSRMRNNDLSTKSFYIGHGWDLEEGGRNDNQRQGNMKALLSTRRGRNDDELKIRLWDLDFYDVIVDEAAGRINYILYHSYKLRANNLINCKL